MKQHGITTATPSNIPFGAGVYFKNLKWDTQSKTWKGDCVGATKGGGKIEIQGELYNLELDGALVRWKGQAVKVGGTAKMEVNMAELTDDNIKMTSHFETAESEAEGYIKYVDKSTLNDGDYLENFAFVGKTADKSKDIIVIMDYALCTSSFALETKNKENAVLKATMEAATNDLTSDLDKIPARIYYPTSAVV